MLQISELYIYPIKSLAGISVTEALITETGFLHDRRWMLVDGNNRFLSQRELAQMALFRVSVQTNGLLVTHTLSRKQILIPFEPQTRRISMRSKAGDA